MFEHLSNNRYVSLSSRSKLIIHKGDYPWLWVWLGFSFLRFSIVLVKEVDNINKQETGLHP